MADALTIDDPAYFARLAAIEAGHWWSLGLWRLVAYWLDGALRDRRGLAALDVGCGSGGTAARLGARPEVSRVIGLDPSPDALGHARACHGFPLVRGSALDLPFAAGSFDLVTCFDVWQHLPGGGDRGAARELARVLRPGGVAVVRANGRGWSGSDATYRASDLGRVLAGAGLRPVRVTYGNCLSALAREARGVLAPARGAGHPCGGGLRIDLPHTAVNRAMGVVAGAEAWIAGRLGVPLPFGHSTLALAERPG